VGDSIVYWAGVWFQGQTGHAAFGGPALHAAVKFHGSRGADVARCKALLLNLWSGSSQRPDVVVVHIGSNNIGNTSAKQLRDELDGLWTFIGCLSESEKTIFIWSDILPRAAMCTVPSLDAVRRGINRYSRRVAIRAQGDFITHTGINANNGALFRMDGLHLSELGQQVFVGGILNGLRQSCPTRLRLLWDGIVW
jgi:lysophospholipase L1-like esterase